MSFCCLRCRKNTKRKNSAVVKMKNAIIRLISKCIVYDSTKSKYLWKRKKLEEYEVNWQE